MINIPLRPKNDSDFGTLKKKDKQIIVAAVLLQLDNQSAFALYHPEYVDANGRLNEAGKRDSKFFWNYGKHKEYRIAFETTVEGFLNGKKSAAKSENVSIDENRIENALKKLLNQAIGLLDSGDNLDPDSVKTIVEVFRKMNLLRDEEEQQEKPRRYLPETCSSCLYRSTIESYVEDGEIENTCLRCKALAIAAEQGFRYDPKTLLNPENPNSDEKNN